MKEKLLSRIAERKITVGVVGLGYVGLPLAVEKAKAGFRTGKFTHICPLPSTLK